MSRDIDTSDPDNLSEDDLIYLADRGQLPEGVDDPRLTDEDEEPQQAGGETISEYDSMTADELKDELKTRGLPTSGTKAELVSRLEDDDSGG